jgi:hypothetical protein
VQTTNTGMETGLSLFLIAATTLPVRAFIINHANHGSEHLGQNGHNDRYHRRDRGADLRDRVTLVDFIKAAARRASGLALEKSQ